LIRVVLLVVAGWVLLLGIFFLLGRLRVIKSERVLEAAIRFFVATGFAGFWVLVALAGWWFFFGRGGPDPEVAVRSSPPAQAVPRGAAITTPEDAFKAFEASDYVTCRQAFPLPPDKAEDGRASLVCGRVFVGDSDHPWQITVWIWGDPFFAEEDYREQCDFYQEEKEIYGAPIREWLIYERGHRWVAVFRDDDLDKFQVPAGEPSRDLAELVASTLGSSPWKDCGAVS
jgi:hypothetical protein